MLQCLARLARKGGGMVSNPAQGIIIPIYSDEILFLLFIQLSNIHRLFSQLSSSKQLKYFAPKTD